MNPRIKTTAVLGTVLLAFGCTDADKPLTPVAPETSSIAPLATSPQRVRGEEADFFALARELPGFGGYFYDAQGNLVAYLKDRTQSGKASALLGTVLTKAREKMPAERQAKFKEGQVLIRQGQFAFAELAAWRDQLTESSVLDLPGVVFTDADEVQNRVVIAVNDAATRAQVAQELSTLGIPTEAVAYETFADGEELNPSYDIGPGESGTLRDQTGPIMGGKKISWYNSSDGKLYACTVAFATTYNSASAAVTNSHCSRTRGELEYTPYYFPYAQHVGTEVKDPAFSNNCDWMVWQKCRNADAIIFNVPSYPTQRGYIARPRTWHTDNSDAVQYVEIDQYKPTFTISGTADTKAGTYVDKVGQRTGWTFGVVEKTCVDTSTSLGHKFRCQHLSKAAANHGDSGSPVFYWDGDTVRFLGTLWGRVWNSFEYYQVYSSDNRIFLDLGTLPITP